jgi:hypothetical protein
MHQCDGFVECTHVCTRAQTHTHTTRTRKITQTDTSCKCEACIQALIHARIAHIAHACSKNTSTNATVNTHIHTLRQHPQHTWMRTSKSMYPCVHTDAQHNTTHPQLHLIHTRTHPYTKLHPTTKKYCCCCRSRHGHRSTEEVINSVGCRATCRRSC